MSISRATIRERRLRVARGDSRGTEVRRLRRTTVPLSDEARQLHAQSSFKVGANKNAVATSFIFRCDSRVIQFVP